MRAKVRTASPEITLARVLAALELELVNVTDVEIREAAQDLGMNLDMKGSAAFAGLTFPAKASFAEYFGPDAYERLREMAKARRGGSGEMPVLPQRKREYDEGDEGDEGEKQ
jgi:hypothetical protein